AWGMDPNMLLAWHKYGGGKELQQEIYKSLNLDVVSFLYGPMPTQPLGWFKKPITKPEDFKGLKFRTVGLSIDIFTGLGAAVNALPGAEIVPAMDRGLLDAAEFNNASSDRALGFQDVSKVCMLRSFHQCSEQFEILFNRKRYEALSPKLRALIANAVDASSAEMSMKAIDRYAKDYQALQEQGVKFYATPNSVFQAQLKNWDEIDARKRDYWQPYHDALSAEIARLRRAHANVLVWEAHSIAGVLPRLFDGKLPDLNIGTHSGASCAPTMRDAVIAAAAGSPYTWVADGRFKGGHITRHYGQPAQGVHTIQLEMVQAVYMDEQAPFPYLPEVAARVQPVLRNMLDGALAAMAAL
ncbi:UNVERIFIED_CONTAM: N-formylglutamate amidohydrolase, partial [Microbacterium sp. SLM126]